MNRNLNLNHIRDLASLTKPRLTSLVILSAGAGMALAPGSLSTLQILGAVLGTCGVVAAANTLNCYLERDVDGFMERTKNRPLVTGKVLPQTAYVLGWTIALLSTLILVLSTNVLTALLGFLGFALYVGVYTPMKRVSMHALFAGAIPGALPPVMGWTAVEGRLSPESWMLFGILFCWQLPHFIAISLHRQKEYDAAGLKTLPGTLGRELAQKHMLIYTAFLVFVSLLPVNFGVAGWPYAITAAILGVAFGTMCVLGFFHPQKWNWGRMIFWGSLVYLPVLLGMWVADQSISQLFRN